MTDREKVIKGLETHIKPNSRCVGCPYPNNGLCGDQLYHDALSLIKEQEPVEPKVSSTEQRCGSCNKVIEMDGWIACPWCGKLIAWNEWWNKNGGQAVKLNECAK